MGEQGETGFEMETTPDTCRLKRLRLQREDPGKKHTGSMGLSRKLIQLDIGKVYLWYLKPVLLILHKWGYTITLTCEQIVSKAGSVF